VTFGNVLVPKIYISIGVAPDTPEADGSIPVVRSSLARPLLI